MWPNPQFPDLKGISDLKRKKEKSPKSKMEKWTLPLNPSYHN